ncbi:dihydrolipoyl dehydrogenase [Tetragenococcus halophilus]|uniref:dihydrolipoyl dehydrogenase n=1 Tax=Tetragenococcus halophilus TaxID=51669 RepID=UPI0030F3011D
MNKSPDLLILGGGTGGYVAAIKAAQQGMSVILVEKDKLGGTCLHKGCIPTKALLRSAEIYDSVKKAEEFGIENDQESIVNFQKIQERKQAIVDQLHKGVQGLIAKNKITLLEGTGTVMGPSIFSPVSGAVIVTLHDGEEEILTPKKLLIATGSRPKTLPSLPLDEEYILSSDGMLEIEELPEKMVIVGGGVIGSEWGSLLNSLGVEVTIIEYLDRLLPAETKNVSKVFRKEIEAKGIKVKTNSEVKSAEVNKEKQEVELLYNDSEKLTVDKVMVAVGREPNIDSIGLMNTSIKWDEKGIHVNDFYQTAEDHIYAIGDCIDTLQLAHVATKEGEIAVKHMAEEYVEPLNYTNVPRATYSSPEVASVGYIKENLPEDKKVSVGKFPFAGNGKALIHGDSAGFVEVLRDEETDDLLGVSIIGPHATELIAELSTSLYMDASPMEIGDAIHAHPSLSEATMEAALDTYKLAIHK